MNPRSRHRRYTQVSPRQRRANLGVRSNPWRSLNTALSTARVLLKASPIPSNTNRGRARSRRRQLPVGEALEVMTQQEIDRLIDHDALQQAAVRRCEQTGVVFVDALLITVVCSIPRLLSIRSEFVSQTHDFSFAPPSRRASLLEAYVLQPSRPRAPPAG